MAKIKVLRRGERVAVDYRLPGARNGNPPVGRGLHPPEGAPRKNVLLPALLEGALLHAAMPDGSGEVKDRLTAEDNRFDARPGGIDLHVVNRHRKEVCLALLSRPFAPEGPLLLRGDVNRVFQPQGIVFRVPFDVARGGGPRNHVHAAD